MLARKRLVASFLAFSLLPMFLMLSFIPTTTYTVEAQKIPDNYIVVLRDDVTDPGAVAKNIAQKHGLVLGLVYKHALKGFSATIPPPALDKVKSDARVSFVEQDQLVQAFLHTNNFETLTTGINRIDAELNPRTDVSSVDIAIIDTGIWLTHIDLNVLHGVTCAGAGSPGGNDDNGHGTHVAGIAAAKTNDNKGVRGVAPNAVLWAVKVLDKNGSGTISCVIAGIDYVTANAAQIEVANMSLGCECTTSAGDTAINNSVAAGVTYAVAAGNARPGEPPKDVSGLWPASNPNVITVSAMGDSDGKCGGQGSPTSDGPDDTFATFSNFGAGVDLAAPGVDITSTWKGDTKNPGGLYATASGTSMSAPHVAGAAAQYIASNLGKTPAQVQSALINSGVPQNRLCNTSLNNGNGGFTGDPDSSPEPLVYVGVTAADFSISASPSALTIQAGSSGSSTITVTSLNGFSGTVSLVTSAPTGLSAILSSSSLTIASGGSSSSTLSITVSSTTASGTYTVTVTGTSGSLTHSTTVTVTVPTVPSAPQNLVATAGNAQITLSWSAPLSDGGSAITNYNIYRGTVSGGETLLTTIGNVLTYTDTTVTNGVTYFYQVTAVNSVGESAKSNEASATPSASASTMIVGSITFSETKNNLFVTVLIVDKANPASPIPSAHVFMTLSHQSGTVWNFDGFTGTDGKVKFKAGNAPSGSYTATVTNVEKLGWTFETTATATETYVKTSVSPKQT